MRKFRKEGKKMLIWRSDYRSVSQRKILALPGITFIIAIEDGSVQCSVLEWNYRCYVVCWLIRFSSPFTLVRMCRRSCIVLIDLSVLMSRVEKGEARKVSMCRMRWRSLNDVPHVISHIKSH